MIFIFLAIIISLMVASLLYLCTISGLFHCIEIKVEKSEVLSQPSTIAYKFIKGPYKSVGPYFTEACGIAPNCKQMIGLYFDNPENTDEDECRSAIGSVLDPNASNYEDVKKLFIENDFKLKELPGIGMAVSTCFPYITFLSIYFAVFRVYPVINNYIKEKKLNAFPAIEIYVGETIHFIFPLDNQKDFFVPEISFEQEKEENSEDITDQCSTVLKTTSESKEKSSYDSDQSSSSFEQLDREELAERAS